MAITLNGVTVKPSTIEPELVVIGEELEAPDGTITQIRRGGNTKWRWTLTWEKVSASVRNQIRTIALLNTTFTFVDEDGTSYTVLTDMQPYSSKNAAFGADGTTVYYDVTLKIQEES